MNKLPINSILNSSKFIKNFTKNEEKMKTLSIVISVAGVIASIIKFYHLHKKNKRTITKYKIYTLNETAKLIGVNSNKIKELIDKKELNGKNINGKYRIIGKAIVDYFS